jgi:tetratricopeptide (TPR) repeat protein
MKNQKSRVSPYALVLATLDQGGYSEAIAFVNEHPATHDPDDALLRAEVAHYLEQHEEMRAHLALLPDPEIWMDDDGDEGERARRKWLIEAERAMFDGELATAERISRLILSVTPRIGDTQSELRALYNLGRIARYRAEYEVGIERLEKALLLAQASGNVCYEGRVSNNLGYCWYYLSDLDRAVSYLRASIELLTRSENLRFRATSETFFGVMLMDLGQLDEALEMCEHAEQTAASLGIMADMVISRANTARTLLAMGKYAETESSLADLLTWVRETGNVELELNALRLLTIAQCVGGRLEEARRSAGETLRLAEIAGTDSDRLDGRLLVERTRSLAQETDAAANLELLVAETDRLNDPYLQAESRIYLSRALMTADPIRARAITESIRGLAVLKSYYWLRHELGLVERDLGKLPVFVNDTGALVMDSRFGWPDFKKARETAERYWLERALEHTNGNASAAARLLGLTRNEMHHLYHLVIVGDLPRPSRAKDPDAANIGAARRRARVR